MKQGALERVEQLTRDQLLGLLVSKRCMEGWDLLSQALDDSGVTGEDLVDYLNNKDMLCEFIADSLELNIPAFIGWEFYSMLSNLHPPQLAVNKPSATPAAPIYQQHNHSRCHSRATGQAVTPLAHNTIHSTIFNNDKASALEAIIGGIAFSKNYMTVYRNFIQCIIHIIIHVYFCRLLLFFFIVLIRAHVKKYVDMVHYL
jgi:hypothetical protein